jgi:hypothetical protein
MRMLEREQLCSFAFNEGGSLLECQCSLRLAPRGDGHFVIVIAIVIARLCRSAETAGPTSTTRCFATAAATDTAATTTATATSGACFVQPWRTPCVQDQTTSTTAAATAMGVIRLSATVSTARHTGSSTTAAATRGRGQPQQRIQIARRPRFGVSTLARHSMKIAVESGRPPHPAQPKRNYTDKKPKYKTWKRTHRK